MRTVVLATLQICNLTNYMNKYKTQLRKGPFLDQTCIMSRRFSLKLIIAGYNCFGLSREDWSEIFFHVMYIPAGLFFITISNHKYLNSRSLTC